MNDAGDDEQNVQIQENQGKKYLKEKGFLLLLKHSVERAFDGVNAEEHSPSPFTATDLRSAITRRISRTLGREKAGVGKGQPRSSATAHNEAAKLDFACKSFEPHIHEPSSFHTDLHPAGNPIL
jgi:hypothetical protein